MKEYKRTSWQEPKPYTEVYVTDKPINETQKAISDVCDELKSFLIAKNNAYGNSALEPLRILSKSDTEEQLNVRIDDKLSRLMRGTAYAGDNDIDDLIGYLILKKVYRKLNS